MPSVWPSASLMPSWECLGRVFSRLAKALLPGACGLLAVTCVSSRKCREATCIAACCTQMIRQLAGSPGASVAAVSSLDTYGWDVSIARMYRFPPLWRLSAARRSATIMSGIASLLLADLA